MAIQINQELCTGCGLCMEACTHGAIQLRDQQARIDNALCMQCEACMEACPNKAISVLSIPARTAPVVALSAPEIRIVPTRNQVAVLETTAPDRSKLAPLAGAVLAFLGREVAQRLADVLLAALERKLVQPTTTTLATSATSSRGLTELGIGKRRHARYRRGRPGYRIHKERR